VTHQDLSQLPYIARTTQGIAIAQKYIINSGCVAILQILDLLASLWLKRRGRPSPCCSGESGFVEHVELIQSGQYHIVITGFDGIPDCALVRPGLDVAVSLPDSPFDAVLALVLVVLPDFIGDVLVVAPRIFPRILPVNDEFTVILAVESVGFRPDDAGAQVVLYVTRATPAPGGS
jgi:hypothetical protein